MKPGTHKAGIRFPEDFSEVSVYARPHPGPLPRGEGVRRRGAGKFLGFHCRHRFQVIGGGMCDNSAHDIAQNPANDSPSPGGEGRGEGGRLGFSRRFLVRLLLLTTTLSPTSLWACAACGSENPYAAPSPLASGMNWGILTLLGILLTVLSGAMVFIVHIIRKEEAATDNPPPENPPGA